MVLLIDRTENEQESANSPVKSEKNRPEIGSKRSHGDCPGGMYIHCTVCVLVQYNIEQMGVYMYMEQPSVSITVCVISSIHVRADTPFLACT